LVVLTIRAMSDGKGYSARHLENNDYYAEGERVTGQWHGRGAELLGLIGDVNAEDFEAVRQGLDPKTKTFLRLRHSADRLTLDGTRLGQGRSLYDFTISAPKSVSVMATVGEDERLIAAHETAAAEALREMEQHAASRVRRDGANGDRTTGNLILALYQHDTSRELDPQLHTHAVAANLTYDGVEGRWKALQASEIYERRAYFTEVYRNALAREVRALGYKIENRRDSKDRDSGFEISGVPAELLAKFSQRSQQRDKAIGGFVEKNGRQPTNNEIAVLVRESRADKLLQVSTTEVRKRQKTRLTPHERYALEGMKREGRAIGRMDSAEPSLEYAKDHIFERQSVARDYDILTEALRHGRGAIDAAELKGVLTVQESMGGVLRSGGEIATIESLEREHSMIASINRGIGSFAPLGTGQFVISDRLRPEQKNAVEFILGSRDRAVSISGAAGTGKTAALQELRRGLTEAGRNVIAVAPTMSAVEELQNVGFTGAITVARLVQDLQTQSELKAAVVIVDEAGMVSNGQMADIIRLAEQQDARIVFSGDTKQVQSVEAGDALRVLERESRLKSVGLTQVQRQTRKEYRQAIEELRGNPERGFAKLDAIGAVQEVAWHQRGLKVAQAYVTSAGRSSLVVCATHDEIGRVTEAIRDQRKRTGQLGESAVIDRHVSLNWTTAQKADPRNFRPGQLLGFHRAVLGIAKNETVEVVRIEEKRIVVRGECGERTLTGKQAKSFDVLEQRPIEVAPGDRLLLTANRRDAGFRATNGEIVTVARVGSDRCILLEDGRTIPGHFRQFTHGYAVTAHRSQGKSVDSVIISADGMQKELFYVAASRGRESITVVTSDKQRLQRTVAKSMARKSASELVRGARPCLHRGAHRGLAAARDLVKRAARYVPSILKRVLSQQVHEPRKERTHERGFSR
jgi:conjugative relaxase-like TrwC/TraI family protein